jgi:hypothetical protein
MGKLENPYSFIIYIGNAGLAGPAVDFSRAEDGAVLLNA